jgi:phosphoserine phosphatase
MDGGRGWGIVFDCDGTLFPQRIGSLMKLVDDRALPEEAKHASSEIRDFYLPHALDGTLSAQQERDWLVETVRLYIECRLSKLQLRQALNDARFRPGTAKGLRELHRAGVKMAVISYGVSPLIREALDINGVSELFASVCAADMICDEAGRFTGYDPHTFVLPDDKGEWSRLFALAHNIPDDRMLAVGDSGGDRKLGILKRNRLGVTERKDGAVKLREIMGDVVMVNRSFTPAIRWLKNKIGLGIT